MVDALSLASDAGLILALRSFGRCGKGAIVRDGVLLIQGPPGSSGSYAHAAVPLDAGCSATRAVTVAREHAARCHAPVVLWTRAHDVGFDHAAALCGIAPQLEISQRPGMVTTEPFDVDRSADCSIELTQDRGLFAEVVARAYALRGVTPEAATALLGNPRLYTEAGHHAMIARYRGRPVACALAFVADGIGVLTWIGSAADVRRQGFGAAVTSAATKLVFLHGARVVTLQATEEGEPLYRRLGFRVVTEYVRYRITPIAR